MQREKVVQQQHLHETEWRRLALQNTHLEMKIRLRPKIKPKMKTGIRKFEARSNQLSATV
jgi:transaldolase